MPTQRGIKSEAIRRVLAENPQASVKEIVSLVAKRGLRVRPTMVYYIRSKQRHEVRRQKRQRAGANGAAYSVKLILGAMSLARDAGGIKNLKQLVDALTD